MRHRTDATLREALYALYVALFEAKRSCPTDFHWGRLTTIQTAVMGIENHGWRVVGITPEALELLAAHEFRKDRVPRQLCRGHVVDRARTTRLLFDRDAPLPLQKFFQRFLKNDKTVIMLNEQNRGRQFPQYIRIGNRNSNLFPNGSLMGWKHREAEREFLMWLYAFHQVGA